MFYMVLGLQPRLLHLLSKPSTICISSLLFSIFFPLRASFFLGLIPFLVPLRDNIICFILFYFLNFLLVLCLLIFYICCPYSSLAFSGVCFMFSLELLGSLSCVLRAWLLGVLGVQYQFLLPCPSKAAQKARQVASLPLSLGNRLMKYVPLGPQTIAEFSAFTALN